MEVQSTHFLITPAVYRGIRVTRLPCLFLECNNSSKGAKNYGMSGEITFVLRAERLITFAKITNFPSEDSVIRQDYEIPI